MIGAAARMAERDKFREVYEKQEYVYIYIYLQKERKRERER